MKNAIRQFFFNPWPFAVLAVVCFVEALAQDNLYAMIMGFWAAAITYANVEYHS